MSTLSNIPEARYDWLVETMRLLRPGMPSAEQEDRFNAVHALITLGLAYALGPVNGRTYLLTIHGESELRRINALKGAKDEPA